MLKRLLFTLWLALALSLPVVAQDQAGSVLVITLDGPLTPSMQSYLQRSIQTAEQRQAEALIVELNTPGGSVTLMGEMVQAIRASSVPVIVYVTPRGAMAGSAGTVITVAGHASAMAPETAIGAASPVGPQGENLETTLAAKEKNILKATVRSLAARRSEQAIALAESTIESAQAASANEAYQVGLVDFIANDLNDLLRQMDGFQVETVSGPHVLHTAGVTATLLSPSVIEQILDTLTDPNIVFLLLTIGVQAILIELSSPGGWVAGFIGVVCLALATYGLGVLPVNWFGLIFIATSFVLFILDIKAPTHGALTTAGVATLIVGALVLFNSPGVPSFQRVSVPLILAASTLSGLLFFGILVFALRAQQLPVSFGQESLVGKTGLARTELKPTGMVQLGGEQWTAELVEGEAPLPKGTRVVVERVEGLRLRVRKSP
jgi:membrane-bound serine protease (ClpP class)